MAGTSCTAFASIGEQLGIRDATILPFLAWVCLRVILQEPEILHENSTRFPVSILQRFLGHIYMIDATDVDAAGYGGAVRRERKLTRLHHKIKVLLIEMPFNRFNQRFQRICSMSWREYYCQHLFTDETLQAHNRVSHVYVTSSTFLLNFDFWICVFRKKYLYSAKLRTPRNYQKILLPNMLHPIAPITAFTRRSCEKIWSTH